MTTELHEEADERVSTALKTRSQEKQTFESQIASLQKEVSELTEKLTGDEEMVRLRQELLDTRKERFDMMCQADKFGKENVNLKEELRDSELARSNTQVYYEKKIQKMKTEIEKMRSSSTSSQEYVFFFFQNCSHIELLSFVCPSPPAVWTDVLHNNNSCWFRRAAM